MSQATRFIMLAVAGWIGLRAVSLGMVPGGEASADDRAARHRPLPALVATAVRPARPRRAAAAVSRRPAPTPPIRSLTPCLMPSPRLTPPASRAARRCSAPRHRSPNRATGVPRKSEGFSLAPAAARYAGATMPLEQWPLAEIARGPGTRRAQSTPAEAIRAIPGIDRLSMSAWAMMRRDPGPASLATNGQLGGSQAGARFLWRFDRRLAASIRSSAPVGGVQRSAELAAGLRVQPFVRIPVALPLERRQSFGPDKGRSAFAIFAEGGVYDRPILAGFNLDAYLQAGVVGIRDHAAFVDGSATLTRPLWRQFSAGFGVWGGAQPGLARLDAGPRVSMRLGRSMRVHVDYRHRFLGKAAPGSGPVLTLAGDF